MAGRPERPRLQAPDLSPPTRPPSGAPPKTDAGDPRFDAAAKLETHDAFVRGMQDGRVRVVNPETAPPAPPAGDDPRTVLSTKVPEYVMQQLRRRYARTASPSKQRSSWQCAETDSRLRTTTFRTSASGRDNRAFGVSGNNGFGRSHGLCRKREGDRPGLPRRPDRQGDDSALPTRRMLPLIRRLSCLAPLAVTAVT